jgi:hypothetical protein
MTEAEQIEQDAIRKLVLRLAEIFSPTRQPRWPGCAVRGGSPGRH